MEEADPLNLQIVGEFSHDINISLNFNYMLF